MKTSILVMKPYCREVLWGGERLHTDFGFDIPSAHTGEAWLVSAVGEAQLSATDTMASYPFPGESVVSGGPFDGYPLSRLFAEHRELFGDLKGDAFPLLIKLIDAEDDLSVQVHPDDAYAREYEGVPFGKNECWLILDAAPKGTIIAGHTAPDRASLKKMIEEKDWAHLLCRQDVAPGDFLFIPAGTVHALCRQTLLLEIQQTSNLTYRLYDYDRLQDGAPRPLHIEKAIDVITCPQEVHPVRDERTAQEKTKAPVRTLLKNDLFVIEELYVTPDDGDLRFHPSSPYFTAVCVVDGEGEVLDESESPLSLKKGTVFLATAFCKSLVLRGRLRLVTAAVG